MNVSRGGKRRLFFPIPCCACPAAFLLGLLFLDPAQAGAKTFSELLIELGYHPVKLEVAGNHYFLDTRINGKLRRAMVDTGASVCAVDNNIAAKLTRTGNSTLLEGRTKRELVALDRFEIGGLGFSNVTAVVVEMAEPHEGKVLTGTHLALRSSRDVIVGMNFLESAHAILQTTTRTLFLRGRPPTTAQTNLLARTLAASGMTNAPCSRDRSGRWAVPAIVNGHTSTLLVDTGAFATGLDASAAKLWGVTGQHTRMRTAGVENRRGTAMVARVELLEVVGCRFKNFPVGVADFSMWNLEQAGEKGKPLEGLVACDLLGRAKAILDFHAGSLWVSPATLEE